MRTMRPRYAVKEGPVAATLPALRRRNGKSRRTCCRQKRFELRLDTPDPEKTTTINLLIRLDQPQALPRFEADLTIRDGNDFVAVDHHNRVRPTPDGHICAVVK